MRPSPLQLNQLFFEKFLIELNGKLVEDSFRPTFQSGTEEFEGVNLVSGVDSFPADKSMLGCDYLVRLRFAIPNDKGTPCRYTLDATVVGAFTVTSDKIPEAERENFVLVNGASLLYGAIREQVAMFSARSLPGPMLLPTVNFLDLKTKPQVDASPPAQRQLESPSIP